MKRKLVLLPLCVFGLMSLYAQTPTGTIQGTVSDSSGGAIPGVKVTITNVATNEVKTLTTDDSGRYRQPFLLTGTYTVLAEKEGFRGLRQDNVKLDVGQNRSVDVVLEVGVMTQQISVEGAPPTVDVNTSSIGQVIENKRVVDLPLQGRGVFNLAALTPGVNPTGGGATPAMGGGRNAMSEIQIDGMTDIAPENNVGNNQRVYEPQVDSVAEFSVQVNALAAEYGRFAGGVINLATKSGTNQLHGTAYDYLRNDKLNANGWANNKAGRPRGVTRNNQFGFTTGGPVVLPHIYDGRNKSFFFVGLEGNVIRGVSSFIGTMPLESWKAGNFSDLRTSTGTPIVVYDPQTGRTDPTDSTKFIRDPFPNNVIPSDRLNPVSKAMAKYWPTPNATPINIYTQQNNFANSGSAKTDSYRLDTRFDQNWTDNWRMFARVSDAWSTTIPLNGFGNLGTSSGDGPAIGGARSVSIDHAYTFSPSLIGNFRYGFSRNRNIRAPFSDGFDLAALGFPSSYVSAAAKRGFEFPREDVSGNLSLASLGQGTFTRYYMFPMAHSATASLTKVTSSHTFKFGGEFRKLLINFAQYGQPSGQFNYNAAWTQREINTTSGTAGAGLASFLLGLPNGGQMSHEPSAASASTYLAGYIQDDWKITRKLTLNVGVRYDVDIPRTERYNQYSYFNIGDPSPLQGQVAASAACPGCGNLKGAMQFVTPSNRHQTPTDSNNIGPRFGFAYNFASKTVLRGAYGIAYAPSAMQASGATGAAGMEGFSSTTGFSGSFDSNRTVYANLSNPYPGGFNFPTGTSLGAKTNLGVGVQDSFFDAYKSPYVQQWNMNLQRLLPGDLVVEVGYLGNHTIGLVDGEAALAYNQLPGSFLSMGTALQVQVDNPFYGKIPYTTGALAQPKVQAGQLLRPYPQYTALGSYRKASASSIYHGMTIRADKRFSHGMSVLFAYTAGKLIDNASSAVSFIGPIAATHLDFYNRNLDRSVSSMDVSQRAVISYVYEMPFGKGKRLLSNLPRGLNMIVTGWQVNGITTFSTGTPIFVSAQNNTNIFTTSQRPLSNGTSGAIDHSGQSTDQRMAMWFNPAVYSQPAAFTFGNVGRTLPDVRNPGINMTDLSAFKNSFFGPEQRLNLQYRVEAFSAFNHFQLGNPSTSVNTASTLGVITGGSGTRVVQMALKLLW